MIIEPFLDKSVSIGFKPIVGPETSAAPAAASSTPPAKHQWVGVPIIHIFMLSILPGISFKISHATMGTWVFSPQQIGVFYPSHACVNSSFTSLFNSLTSKETENPNWKWRTWALYHQLQDIHGDSTIFWCSWVRLDKPWQLQTLCAPLARVNTWAAHIFYEHSMQIHPVCYKHIPSCPPTAMRLPLRQEAYLELLPILLPLVEDSTILPHRSSPATAIAAEWKKNRKQIWRCFSHTIGHSW